MERTDNEGGIKDGATMKHQYHSADKLSTRISIHSKYSTNKQGFGNWITSHYQIRDGSSVPEPGCEEMKLKSVFSDDCIRRINHEKLVANRCDFWYYLFGLVCGFPSRLTG